MIATNGVAADIEVKTADYLAKVGEKEQAKMLYRNIITIYTGSAYKSEVKKAEFGLEDLKAGSPVPSHQKPATSQAIGW